MIWKSLALLGLAAIASLCTSASSAQTLPASATPLAASAPAGPATPDAIVPPVRRSKPATPPVTFAVPKGKAKVGTVASVAAKSTVAERLAKARAAAAKGTTAAVAAPPKK